MFSSDERSTLRAMMDTVVPPDSAPGGWDGGVRRLVDEHAGGFLHWAVSPLRQACAHLDAAARRRGVERFDGLDDASRQQLVAGLPDDTRSAVIRVAYEGYYGGTREPAGWEVAGFRPQLGISPIEPDRPRSASRAQLRTRYDVIVIGSGPGGAATAATLAESGASVLVIERSRPHSAAELRGNHLQGQRLERYDVVAGPGGGSPRLLEEPGGTRRLEGDGDGSDYGLVAMTLGGGTRLWQGMSWRFLPEDFSMATTYGVPHDSTLADWPFDYAELAPFYDRAEWELGVSGDGTSALSSRTPRARDYPMPVLAWDDASERYAEAARRLGWSTGPIPFAINSVPRSGRNACVRCEQCVGHSCPVDAKNGAQNTFLPRVLAQEDCDLLESAQVVRIEHDGKGLARGVSVAVAGDPAVMTISAGVVIVAAGAVETARLLLASRLGNDWVGRNHHSHGLAMAVATESPWAKDRRGPGHSAASIDFAHSNAAPWGGGVMFDTPVQYPLAAAERGVHAAPSSFGIDHKNWMRAQKDPLGAMSMVQEVPHASTRVTLDSSVTDENGVPAVCFTGTPHVASVDAATFMADRCREWVAELGGTGIFTLGLPGRIQGAEHSAGTARMALDARTGACDPWGRLWGSDNVFVADASLHPTNGGFNPGLTIIANAIRVASHIVSSG